MIFLSKTKRPRIVMQPKKAVKFDGPHSEPGRAIQFDNFTYNAEKEDEISFIRALPNFGSDYWEMDSKAPMVPFVPVEATVTGMATKEEILDQRFGKIDQQISGILAAINTLAGVIDKQNNQEEKPPKDKPPKK